MWFVLSCRNGTKVGVSVFLFLFLLSCRKAGVSLRRKGITFEVIMFLFVLSCRKAGVSLRHNGITIRVIVFLFLFILSCCNGTKVLVRGTHPEKRRPYHLGHSHPTRLCVQGLSWSGFHPNREERVDRSVILIEVKGKKLRRILRRCSTRSSI